MFNGKSAAQKNPVQNLWDFSDKKKKKKKKKKNQNKNKSFSASPKRAEKPTRILSVRMTEQMTFSHFLNYWNNYSLQNSTEGKGRVRFTDGYIDFKDLF